MNILYIALKHMIWRLKICNYFCEISKFRNFMNTLTLFDMGFFEPSVIGGGGGHEGPPIITLLLLL